MSLLGHFRPIQSGFAMSAYPPQKQTSGPPLFMSKRPSNMPEAAMNFRRSRVLAPVEILPSPDPRKARSVPAPEGTAGPRRGHRPCADPALG